MTKDPDMTPGQPEPSGYLVIGRVLRPQGLRGEVKVRPETDAPERFLDMTSVFIKMGEGAYEPIAIRDISLRKGFVYLTMEEDSSVEAAEKRRDLLLYIDRAHATPLGEFENYIADMIGCVLVDTKEAEIGRLKDILQPGANDVYVVKTNEGSLLIPALRHVILEVDIKNKRITVDETRLQEVSILAD